MIDAIKGFVGRLWKRIAKGKKKTPKPVKDKKPKYKPDSSRKLKEMPFALAEAKVIEEIHDRKNSPVAVALAHLNTLRFRYSWIKKFTAQPTGIGRFIIWLIGSKKKVGEYSSSIKLKRLHSDSTLSKSGLEYWSRKSTDDIVESLKSGINRLKIRPEGTILDGNTRVKVLQDRGFNIDSLIRFAEIIKRNPIGPF